MSLLEGPRLWVVASWAAVAASSTIDGGPEPRAVNHCVFNDVKYSNHVFHGSTVVTLLLVAVEHVLHTVVYVGNAVVKLGQLSTVPAVGSAYEIARDTLQLVYVVSATLWASI